ncbi:MAG: hypothetical protein IT168_13885 [Bryobacterales bacterium]|nr:hypothetical protein [Bryobacterales bacterium]
MLPWVYGFHWSAGHLIFLGVFFTAVLVVGGTLLLAIFRGRRDLASGRASHIVWHEEFSELPASSRQCRHAFTREMPGRICPLGFDCRECATHARLIAANELRWVPGDLLDEAGHEMPEPAGLSIPADRFYHRGHTWVQPQDDGTVLVGLDDLARRLVGRPTSLKLPAPGTQLVANLPAWTIRRNNSEVRIPAPIDGEVVDTAADQPWTLRLKPALPLDTRHLLRGREVRAWFANELQRLEMAASGTEGAVALADGGLLVEDLTEALPADSWERICGEMFLEA